MGRPWGRQGRSKGRRERGRMEEEEDACTIEMGSL
jgi:hypothetical protein